MRLPGRPSCHYRWGVKWVSYFVIKYSHRIPGVSEIYDYCEGLSAWCSTNALNNSSLADDQR